MSFVDAQPKSWSDFSNSISNKTLISGNPQQTWQTFLYPISVEQSCRQIYLGESMELAAKLETAELQMHPDM